MATINDMAYDYAMERGHGNKTKAHENFVAGARSVLCEIQIAFDLGGMDGVAQCINSFIEELNH